MIIKVLAENTSNMDSLCCEHGLSLYIRTNKHNILFDTGASSIFTHNAKKMRVDLEKVDLAVISHGHNDHGGGLKDFLALNKKASIYMQEKAFGDYYAERPGSEKQYIGLAKELQDNAQFVLVRDKLVIDEQLELFVSTQSQGLQPSGNISLYKKENKIFVQDDFLHEQNLVLKEEGKFILIAGCAHSGIVNIMETFSELYERMPTHVIGGLHLYNPALDKNEPVENIKKLADYLLTTGARFYTCHCTGLLPYQCLEEVMGSSNISYLATGNQLIV